MNPPSPSDPAGPFAELEREVFAERSALRAAITTATRADERQCVLALTGEARLSPQSLAAAQARARELAARVRSHAAHSGAVNALMNEFSLSSQEGVAIMCLAEALLRIPDAQTADRLIRDKIARGDWRAHLGHSGSPFVNAAAWGLLVTGKLVATANEAGLSAALSRLLARGGEPLIRKSMDLAMRLLGRQFVAGRTMEEALKGARAAEARGFRHSYDMLGEAALAAADADRYFRSYQEAIRAVGAASAGRGPYAGPGISVKLSALHPRYVRAQRRRVMEELLPRLQSLFALARRNGIGVNIDAEEAERLDLSLDLLEALARDPALSGWDGIGFVVQAYQKRAPNLIEYLSDLARETKHRFMLRLVKGAYWDSEIKRAQVAGLDGYPVFTRKPHTDLCYHACARGILAAPDRFYPQFATHNALTVAAVEAMAMEAAIEDYEFQCLHGMGEALYETIVAARPCRIYAPVGSHETLLPYLVRRLLENGSNNSFVNRIVDEAVTLDELVADPVAATERSGATPHPRIAQPRDLFAPARRNSAGLDFSDERSLARLAAGLSRGAKERLLAAPVLAAGGAISGNPQPVRNPAEREDEVGAVLEASERDIESALAEAAGSDWQATDAALRAAVLERCADALEENRDALMALCVREAGKTLSAAAAEVREAADFCRYYAVELRARFPGGTEPLGVAVAISPWNFPLAIFTGQVSAALAAGNPVIAKPAEQTPLTAALAVRLLHQAGVPRSALQFLPGTGERVGAALVSDPRVRAVLFTGSTETARRISRALAGRGGDAALIAETGGQNAMIVDSSALAEQVVQDVLASAFDSAGQRCSALRVLYLQQEIAEATLAMLEGAMRELSVGNPARLSTDVGPVIDEKARERLQAHVAKLKPRLRCQTELPQACGRGIFFPPSLIEIESIRELSEEVFGPVLHVARYRREALDRVIEDINATGYGLTMGIHSRVGETVDYIVSRARAGNIYVNRNMIGAVVGVQPFGGEGLSGTGPKAGGPCMLPRLLRGPAPRLGARGRPPPALALLERWASETGQVPLAALCGEVGRETPAHASIELPGPTGEGNVLSFAPRGRALCLGPSEADLLAQLAVSLATGNRALVPQADWLARLPRAVQDLVSPAGDWRGETFDAALFAGAAAEADELRRALAARGGAIVPLLAPDRDGRYPLLRLLTERSLCVNTAAAGGNTALLSLEP